MNENGSCICVKFYSHSATKPEVHIGQTGSLISKLALYLSKAIIALLDSTTN